MVNIPMTAKPPMRAPALTEINRSGGTQTTQTLLRPAAGRAPSSPQPVRPAPSAPSPARSSSPQPVRTAPPVRNHPHPPAAGMTVQKGQKISLSQLSPGLEQVEVGMGWDLGPGGQGYELDVEAFLLNAAGQVPGDDWFVFYNQPVSPDGAVRLLEPGVTNGPRDDAVMQLQLRRLDPGVTRIVFILTINEALEHGRHFGNVADAYVRVLSARREIVRFRLTDYYDSVYSMMVGEIYRYKDEWRFNPVGNGTKDDLAGLCRRYGVCV